MGFSLPDLNPLSLISNAAQAISHQVLPQKLQFVGDLVALGIDYETGNVMGGIADLQKLVADLPQASPPPDNTPGSHQDPSDTWLRRSWDPTPPAPYASTTHTAALAAQGTRPTPTDTTTTAAALTTTAARQSTSTPSGTSQATAAPSTPAQATLGQPTPTETTATRASSASAASTGPDDQFFRQSDADLMNKVASGQIPDSITKDPAKMRELQARMNQISEMNQLISQMLTAIHDMHKQVIQNLRA